MNNTLFECINERCFNRTLKSGVECRFCRYAKERDRSRRVQDAKRLAQAQFRRDAIESERNQIGWKQYIQRQAEFMLNYRAKRSIEE